MFWSVTTTSKRPGAGGEMVENESTRFLQKPFNRDQLLRGIAALLGGHPLNTG
jgi:hypothetical protein